VKEGYPMTPREIVSELDRFIVGQRAAKRAVAIALRNRWRRLQVPEELRDEIAPKNIIMIGPTGVGKTEISRRLAKLAQAPFVKVEASRFTEVGYVGRDVESIIRDLIELAIDMVREEETAKVEIKAREAAEQRVLDLLAPTAPAFRAGGPATMPDDAATREHLARELRAGRLDDRTVEIEPPSPQQQGPFFEVITPQNLEDAGINIREALGNIFGQGREQQQRTQKVTVAEALDQFTKQEAQGMIDQNAVAKEAVRRAEQNQTSRAKASSAICCRSSRALR
jgi:ATP-dependent HslUV protease ATP-binding subunit HslU